MSDPRTLAALVDELLTVQEQMEPLKAREADLKARIRNAAEPGENAAGTHTVTLAPSRRLDLTAIAKAYPATEHPELYVLTPDTKKVRANLAPAAVDGFMKESGEPRVTIK